MQGIYNYLAARLLNSFYVGRFTLIIQLKLTCISDFFAIWIKLFTCKDLLIHASTVHELLFPLSSVFPLLSTNCFLLVAIPQCPNCFSLFQKYWSTACTVNKGGHISPEVEKNESVGGKSDVFFHFWWAGIWVLTCIFTVCDKGKPTDLVYHF